MKILVLGCNGMLGHVVSLYLLNRGYDVTGFARDTKLNIPIIIGDATDTHNLAGLIRNGNYDVVVNCIGILNQSAENHKAQAVFLNSYLPHYLAEITYKLKTKIVHISTDCVFSGKTGGYTEDSVPDGTSFYDRSKSLGDLCDDKNITIRTSIIGPDINSEGIGLFNWFMRQQGTVNGYTKAIWTGQTTLQLAKTIEVAIHNNVAGLHHMVPSISISKYNLLVLFNKLFRKNSLTIVPSDKIQVDKSLIRTNFSLKYDIPTYEEMLLDMYKWIKNNRNLYPHYQM